MLIIFFSMTGGWADFSLTIIAAVLLIFLYTRQKSRLVHNYGGREQINASANRDMSEDSVVKFFNRRFILLKPFREAIKNYSVFLGIYHMARVDTFHHHGAPPFILIPLAIILWSRLASIESLWLVLFFTGYNTQLSKS